MAVLQVRQNRIGNISWNLEVKRVMVNQKKGKVEPIYEKLAPGEVLIISREGDCLTYVANEGGKVVFKRVCLAEED
ncbi:MAG: hypothetical protein JRI84_16255 [Deltaproteobacteria bacterium]|nr:hypothetical protein [Deltaproteobacteria bacterium]